MRSPILMGSIPSEVSGNLAEVVPISVMLVTLRNEKINKKEELKKRLKETKLLYSIHLRLYLFNTELLPLWKTMNQLRRFLQRRSMSKKLGK